MKRILLFIAAATLLLSGCRNEPDVPQFVGTGRHQEFWENGTIVRTSDYTCTLNEQGLVTNVEDYTNDELSYRAAISYDAFGNTLHVIEEQDGTTEIFDYKNTLDPEGRLLRQEVWQDDTMVSFEEYTYDARGNQTSHYSSVMIEGEEDPQWRHRTMSYDKKGRLVREELRWNFNEKYTVWEYENGLCVRVCVYNSTNDIMSEKTELTYDRQGNCVREVTLNPATGKVTESTEYTYDSAGRCTRETLYDRKDNWKQYYEYVYDDTARTKTSTRHYADGSADEVSVVYTYDEYGNSVLREEYRNGQLYWRITQKFEPIP